MIVTCEQCQARYKLDDAKVKGRGAKITCPRCKHTFVVFASSTHEATLLAPPPPPEPPQVATVETPPPTPAPLEAPKPARSKRASEELNFKSVGISTWKVKVKIGLVYDFSDTKTLRKYIQDKRVTEDDVISFDGNEWIRIGDIPDLDSFFVKIYEEQEARLKKAAEDREGKEEIFEDGPTMIVGMGSLGTNISTGIFNKPKAGGSGQEASSPPSNDITTGGGTPTSFVDPFDLLQKRQREKIQARKEGGAPAKSSKSAVQRSVPMFGILGGVVVLLFVGAWYFKKNASSGQTSPVQVTAPPPEPKGLTDDQYRDQVRESIEKELKRVQPVPINPATESESEQGLRPRIPDKARPEETARTPPQPRAPTNPGASTGGQSPSTAADHALIGDEMARQGDWRGAAAAYAKALQVDPSNVKFRHKCGEALYYTKAFDQAAGELTKSANAGYRPSHRLLGNILRDQGDVSGAVGHYQEYLKSNPGDRAAVEAEIARLTGG